MTIPFLNFFKSKTRARRMRSRPTAAVLVPPIDKPSSERFSKTVMPNATRDACAAGCIRIDAFTPRRRRQPRVYSLGADSVAPARIAAGGRAGSGAERRARHLARTCATCVGADARRLRPAGLGCRSDPARFVQGGRSRKRNGERHDRPFRSRAFTSRCRKFSSASDRRRDHAQVPLPFTESARAVHQAASARRSGSAIKPCRRSRRRF